MARLIEICTVIDDYGYRMSASFSREGHLWNITEHQTFFSANEQRLAPAQSPDTVSTVLKRFRLREERNGSGR
ncbi:hypothetical protein V4R08_00065 [Nitrobacter sp. NHB1]|uniref:hypothetical protein n=1 Tax=Nitrobacter sp. NHB1 TaxID=3119830 RepID=UPI002FFD5C11